MPKRPPKSAQRVSLVEVAALLTALREYEEAEGVQHPKREALRAEVRVVEPSVPRGTKRLGGSSTVVWLGRDGALGAGHWWS
ncbi:MAG: hypothetical protein ACUVV6_09310 [Thermoplasmatota archaeon]